MLFFMFYSSTHNVKLFTDSETEVYIDQASNKFSLLSPQKCACHHYFKIHELKFIKPYL